MADKKKVKAVIKVTNSSLTVYLGRAFRLYKEYGGFHVIATPAFVDKAKLVASLASKLTGARPYIVAEGDYVRKVGDKETQGHGIVIYVKK